jgi:hypothetical protein
MEGLREALEVAERAKTRSAQIVLPWADGEYTFRLGLGEFRELQEKCKAGPPAIHRRLLTGEWFIDDIRETVRLGLIGGGLEPARALSKVQRYVDGRPPNENIFTALSVLHVALNGVDDEETPGQSDAKKATGEAETTQTTPQIPSP